MWLKPTSARNVAKPDIGFLHVCLQMLLVSALHARQGGNKPLHLLIPCPSGCSLLVHTIVAFPI